MSDPEKASDDKGVPAEDNLDADIEREVEEALGDMSVEDLMAAEGDRASPPAGQTTPTGEKIRRGTVIAIQGDDIFVDLGGKSQGLLPASQYEDEALPAVGEVVEFTIESYNASEGMLMLSRRGAVQAATWETLEEGQLVEGRVTGLNRGGLELTVNGIRAFMPISQIEMFRVEKLDDYLNQKLPCRVVEVDRSEGNLVVSRRALLEVEAERKAEEFWQTVAEGQIVRGVVRSVMPYGAFVDVGGVDGLLHVKEMSYGRVEDPRHVVTEGQQLEVKVLGVDREQRRISLGLKQTMPDPWLNAAAKWQPGEIATGRVVRLADFGAFVELEPGIEGLLPISEMSYARRVRHPKELLSEGDTVRLKLLSIDPAARRLSLSLKQVGDDPWTGASVRWPVGGIVEGRVSRITDFGAFVELTGGVEGLAHISELSGDFVRSVGEAVQEGQLVKVKVLSVSEESRRISLSVKQAAAPVEAGAAGDESQPAPPRRDRKKPLKGGLD